MEFGLGRTNTGVECVRHFLSRSNFIGICRRVFHSRLLLPGRRRRENCSRRLNWMAAINSGQSAGNGLAPPGQCISCTPRQYSYLSTVIAGYLPKLIAVCGRNRKYATLWLWWLRPRRRWAWLESISPFSNPWQSRFFWDSLSNWNFTTINLD